VFFHYDSTVLTTAAREIIDAAAKSALATNPRKIEVAGYTEANAPPPTRKFAEPRFKAVEAALVADGVDRALLSRAPLPDQEAALPSTADRRVEIRLIDRRQ
jgi:outer membrane protein OmpA-like peptidoglycan-associated protein